jgi:hypothetical protein
VALMAGSRFWMQLMAFLGRHPAHGSMLCQLPQWHVGHGVLRMNTWQVPVPLQSAQLALSGLADRSQYIHSTPTR